MKALLAALMIAAGVLHFLRPKPFMAIVPRALPRPRALVYLSGAAEIALGVGLCFARTQSLAAWGLALLYVAVFPANVNMAVHRIGKLPAWMLWARLPLQAALIWWALQYR